MKEVEIIAANLNEKKNFPNEVKTLRVCAYARVSTDSEEQQTSYNSQIIHYKEQIQNTPNCKFVGIYADEGISGTQVKHRTEFIRMIDDALNGKIDRIIAKSISRFARNTLDTLKYVRLLKDNNVDVYFEKENIHTLDLDSEMFLTLYSAFAQAESESTSQNVKMGLKAKMKRGEFIGRVQCYGYTWVKETKSLVVNEEQAEVVRNMFNWYISGLGSSAIAKKLNELGIPSYKGGIWRGDAVLRIITNEKYIGDLLSQKWYVDSPLNHKKIRNYGEREKYYAKNTHTPIISKDVWNKAQEIYKRRSAISNPNGSTHGKQGYSLRYDFSSKIYCGFCGEHYIRRLGTKRNNGEKNVYWACADKVRSKDNCSDTSFIRDELLKNIFVELYNTIIKDKYKSKDKLLNAIKETLTESNNYKNKINDLNSKEEILRKRLSNLIDMKLDDCISKDDYKEKEKEIKDSLEVISLERKEFENLENDNKNISKKIKEIESIFAEPILLKEFNKDAFDNLVDKIIIGGIDQNGNRNPNVIRFILKTGNEYVTLLDNHSSIQSKSKIVSFNMEQS